MLVMEARSLAFMARALGVDAESWETDYLHRSALIREAFWDESTGFFYNADKADNDFSYRLPNDLKRREISSFLPLWAGIADSVTAKRVMETYLLGGMWREGRARSTTPKSSCASLQAGSAVPPWDSAASKIVSRFTRVWLILAPE
jgi:neutral trehalase